MTQPYDTSPRHYAKSLTQHIQFAMWDKATPEYLGEYFDALHGEDKERGYFTDLDDHDYGTEYVVPKGRDLAKARRLFIEMAPPLVAEQMRYQYDEEQEEEDEDVSGGYELSQADADRLGVQRAVGVTVSAGGAYVGFTALDGSGYTVGDEPAAPDAVERLMSHVNKDPVAYAIAQIEFAKSGAGFNPQFLD